MKLALLVAPLRLASAFVEAPPRGRVVGSPSSAAALRASPDDGRFETTRIRDVRDVVSGNVDDALDTRVPPPNGFENKTPMPMADESATPRRGAAPRKSQALPFAAAPAALDGTLAGDVGFDPLGFADGPANLANYREAEIKHGRLAMLAAAGWPLSELFDKKIAAVLDLEPALNADGRVPSVLNGGMGGISVTYWLGCLVLAAALDVYGSYFATKKAGYVAGDLGFDPLGFYPRGEWTKDQKDRERLRLSEIKHGRLAMIAITAFAAQEFVTHVPVVDQTPLFFRPITEVLSAQVPSYYIPPEAVSEMASTAAAEAAAPIATEAPAAAPEIAVPALVEAAAQAGATAVPEVSAVAPDVVAPVVVEEVAAIVPPTSVVESISAAPADAAIAEELADAKTRIVELETKLAQIDALIR